jgi:GWxTD domain-containing protein
MISRIDSKKICLILVCIGLLTVAPAQGQSLNGMNFNYCYDPNNEIDFVMRSVVNNGNVQVYYELAANRKEFPVEVYTITWQSRADFNDRNEAPAVGRDSVLTKTIQTRDGIFMTKSAQQKWYLVAKVVNTTTQNTFHFFSPIDDLWPPTQLTSTIHGVVSGNYVPVGSSIKFSSDKKLYGYLYREKFTAALPPFAESKPADPFLRADSSFSFSKEFIPARTGLYLIQEDTTAARGVAFLATETSYPKYTRVALLAPPLVYITTDDEYARLSAPNIEKPAFDRVILEITNDKDRARTLMRSYFQRVELANRYFTEYKEGWKTDRGMIYVIYGSPDEVSRTATGETWYYQGRKTKFEFKKSGSVFSPENYRLERDNKFMPEWFSMVDLWRKSRF